MKALSDTLALSLPIPEALTLLGLAAMGTGVLVFSWRRARRKETRLRQNAVLDERSRIARELHDTLAQGLAGVGIQIEAAVRKFDGAHPARQHLQLAREMVRSSLAEVRRSIWVLRAQNTVGRGGVGAVLGQSLLQLTQDTGIRSQLTLAGHARALEPEVERNLLRIAHEAVVNAVKHAAAHHITIALEFERDRLELRVRDDGHGFDPEAPRDQSQGAHFGLAGIAERAHALGGELHVSSREGEGTEVVCRLPYQCRMVDPLELDPTHEEDASL